MCLCQSESLLEITAIFITLKAKVTAGVTYGLKRLECGLYIFCMWTEFPVQNELALSIDLALVASSFLKQIY